MQVKPLLTTTHNIAIKQSDVLNVVQKKKKINTRKSSGPGNNITLLKNCTEQLSFVFQCILLYSIRAAGAL